MGPNGDQMDQHQVISRAKSGANTTPIEQSPIDGGGSCIRTQAFDPEGTVQGLAESYAHRPSSDALHQAPSAHVGVASDRRIVCATAVDFLT